MKTWKNLKFPNVSDRALFKCKFLGCAAGKKMNTQGRYVYSLMFQRLRNREERDNMPVFVEFTLNWGSQFTNKYKCKEI